MINIDFAKLLLNVEIAAGVGAVIGLFQGLGDIAARHGECESAGTGQIRLQLRGQDATDAGQRIDGTLDQPVDQGGTAERIAGQTPGH